MSDDAFNRDALGNTTGVHNAPPLEVGGELGTLYPLTVFFVDRESRRAFAAVILDEIKRRGLWKYGHIDAHRKLTTKHGE